jgi:hypothetical protein
MRAWRSRLLVGLVFAWNVQAALIFLVNPGAYVSGYELNGATGEAAIRGVGVLFLMWNVPYAAALWNPIRYRLALTLALVMQLIGLVGESFILSTLGAEHVILRASILRFILFDAAGLTLLALAAWQVKDADQPTSTP